jgi:hypothetical protein
MTLRKAAASSVANLVATVEGYSQSQGLLTLFDLRSEFASEWAKLAAAAAATGSGGGSSSGGSSSSSNSGPQTLVLRYLNNHLPAFTRGRDASTIRATDVTVLTTLPLQPAGFTLDFAYVPASSQIGGGSSSSSANDTAFDSGPTKMGTALNMYRITEADNAVDTWAIKVKIPPRGADGQFDEHVLGVPWGASIPVEPCP